jgi:hypothetical protein
VPQAPGVCANVCPTGTTPPRDWKPPSATETRAVAAQSDSYRRRGEYAWFDYRVGAIRRSSSKNLKKKTTLSGCE